MLRTSAPNHAARSDARSAERHIPCPQEKAAESTRPSGAYERSGAVMTWPPRGPLKRAIAGSASVGRAKP
jgi:hypothetical protein